MKYIEVEGKKFRVEDYFHWLAQDNDGSWNIYEQKPAPSSDGSVFGEFYLGEGKMYNRCKGIINSDYCANGGHWTEPNPNWKSTLREI